MRSFIETRFFDNGKAKARLHKCENEPDIEASGSYDIYIDEIAGLQEWIDGNLSIETDDVIDLFVDLADCNWIDITNYC
jgi:hypothetical protein